MRIVPMTAAVLFAGYVAIRSFYSPVEYLGRADLHLILASLATYLLTACYLNTARHRWWLLGSIFVIVCFHVVSGALQFSRDDNFMLLSQLPAGFPIPQIFRPDYGWRASGFYGCPNHLAGLLEATAMFALAGCCLGRNGSVGRILYGYVLAMCLAGLAMTGSRGGYISVLFGLAAFSLVMLWVVKRLSSKQIWLVFIGIGVIAAVVIGGALFFMSRSASIQGRVDTVVDPTNMRLFLWAAAMKQFYLSPLVGTGAGTYLYYGRQFRAPEVQNDPIHVHNDYLELLCEYGAVGAVLFAAVLVLHLYSGWQGITSIVRRRLRPSERFFSDELALTVAAIAAVVGLILHSVVDFNLHIPGNTLFFAFIFGVLASPTADVKITAGRAPEVTQLVRFILPVLGGVMLFLGAKQIRGEYHAEWARVQLRNQFFVGLLTDLGQTFTWVLPTQVSGVIAPAAAHAWAGVYMREHQMPRVLREVQAGLATETKNPDIYYYLGEARSQLAAFEPEESEQRALYASAAGAYRAGLDLFPQDARLQLAFARTLDELHLFEEAGRVYEKALGEDPNLGNIYGQYGRHLWLQKKVNRAEAYYKKAESYLGGSGIARAGLSEIQRLRDLAKDPRFIEEVGDPLEGYDLDPPTPEDEARGVTLPEEQ